MLNPNRFKNGKKLFNHSQKPSMEKSLIITNVSVIKPIDGIVSKPKQVISGNIVKSHSWEEVNYQ